MAKQVSVSFKENKEELELYEWVKAKLNPGTYIKELLHNDYLMQKNGFTYAKVEASEAKKEVEEAVVIDDGDYGMQ